MNCYSLFVFLNMAYWYIVPFCFSLINVYWHTQSFSWWLCTDLRMFPKMQCLITIMFSLLKIVLHEWLTWNDVICPAYFPKEKLKYENLNIVHLIDVDRFRCKNFNFCVNFKELHCHVCSLMQILFCFTDTATWLSLSTLFHGFWPCTENSGYWHTERSPKTVSFFMKSWKPSLPNLLRKSLTYLGKISVKSGCVVSPPTLLCWKYCCT